MKQRRERQPGGPEHVGEYHLSEAQSAHAEAAIRAASNEARVNFRWNDRALGVVKQAADLVGVPYQTYLKMATYRQAVADINAAQGIADAGPEGIRDHA